MSANYLSLALVKERGGLVFPSVDVFKIIHICEFIFKCCCGDDFRNPKIAPVKNLKGKIKYRVLSGFRFKNVFTTTNKM